MNEEDYKKLSLFTLIYNSFDKTFATSINISFPHTTQKLCLKLQDYDFVIQHIRNSKIDSLLVKKFIWKRLFV